MELTTVNSRPKDKPPPEYPLILVWNANDASTHHFKIPLPLVLRINRSVHVHMMHCIKCTSLEQSSLLGARTLVVKNLMNVQVSSLARLVAHKLFAARLWNFTILFCFSFLRSLLTTKRLLGAALDFFRLLLVNPC